MITSKQGEGTCLPECDKNINMNHALELKIAIELCLQLFFFICDVMKYHLFAKIIFTRE